jgi:hypothetical protein
MRKALVALVAVALVLGVVLASRWPSGEESLETAELPTRVAATMIPVTPVTAPTLTPSPTAAPAPVSLRPAWVPITAEDLKRFRGPHFSFLLDTVTGQMYSVIAPDMAYDELSGGPSWAVTGELLIALSPSMGAEPEYFLGPALGEIRSLPRGREGWGGGALSVDGLLAYASETENVLYDTGQQQMVGTLPDPPWRPQAWSDDGRYLLLEQGSYSSTQPGNEPMVAVWDQEVARVVAEWPGEGASWSGPALQVVYRSYEPSLPFGESLALKVRDFATGSEFRVGKALEGTLSPDGTYTVATFDEEGDHGFRVHELASGALVLTARNAWFDRWLDDEAVGLVGSACASPDYYKLNVANADLLKMTAAEGRHTAPQASPDFTKFAHTRIEESGFVTVVETAAGKREFSTGAAFVWTLPGYAGAWSPDGRYLVVTIPPGKDGPCFVQVPGPLAIEVP